MLLSQLTRTDRKIYHQKSSYPIRRYHTSPQNSLPLDHSFRNLVLAEMETNKTVNRVPNFPFECKTVLHTFPKAAFAPSDKHTPTAEKHKENSCSRCSLLASVSFLPAPCLCRACAKCAPNLPSSMKEMAPGGVYLSGELLCLRGNEIGYVRGRYGEYAEQYPRFPTIFPSGVGYDCSL